MVPNSASLAFVATHNTIAIWNILQQRSVATLVVTGNLRGIAWSPDRKAIAACIYEGWVQFWDTLTYQQKNMYRTIVSATTYICWSPDNNTWLLAKVIRVCKYGMSSRMRPFDYL